MKTLIICNFLAIQFGWLITVTAAAGGMPVIGPLFTLAWMIIHLRLVGADRGIELRLIGAAVLLGAACDSLLAVFGVIAFPEQSLLGQPTTLWMVTLWVNLAMTLRHSLGWLRGRYLLAAVLGAVAGPLAYLGGERLGGIIFPSGHSALALVALEWLTAMPALMVVTRWSEALAARPTTAAAEAGYDRAG